MRTILQDNIKRYNIRIIGVPEEEDKKKDHEKILEEIIRLGSRALTPCLADPSIEALQASASQLDAPRLLVWTEPPASEASLVAQMVKNPSVMKENQVRSLGWEDPLEKGMATHSSILAWRIPTDRGAWWATVHWVVEELDTNE